MVSDLQGTFFCSITRPHLVKADGLFGRSPYSSSCICMLSKTTSVVEAKQKWNFSRHVRKATWTHNTGVLDGKYCLWWQKICLSMSQENSSQRSPAIATITRDSIACFMGGLLRYLVLRQEECELSPQRLDFITSPHVFLVCPFQRKVPENANMWDKKNSKLCRLEREYQSVSFNCISNIVVRPTSSLGAREH